MHDENTHFSYFLDTKTGDVVSAKEDTLLLDHIRYFKIPKIHHTSKEKWMKEFIRDFVYVEDKKLAKELKNRFEYTGLTGVRDYLEGYGELWLTAWDIWEEGATLLRLEEWLATLPVAVETKDWHGDDCVICRTMQDGADEEDFLEAFVDQNEINAKGRHQLAQTNTDKTLKDIEDTLEGLLKKHGHEKELSVVLIKERILNASGSAMEANNKYLIWWTQFFEKEFEARQFEPIMQAFTDAWNYFPHKALGNKSPNDLVCEMRESAPETDDKRCTTKMPTVIVGGESMSFDEYKAMLKRMERKQLPFKKWIDQVQRVYVESLEAEGLRKEIVGMHKQVAKIFFDRVLQVGFVTFDRIRPEFVTKEFPTWWQTHVMFSKLKEKDVSSLLKKLFVFIEAEFGITHVAFSKQRK